MSLKICERLRFLSAFLLCCRVRRRVQGQVKMVATILETAPMRKMSRLESCFPPLPSRFLRCSQTTNWMMGLETRMRLAAMPFQRVSTPSSLISFLVSAASGLFSLDCLVCSTQKGLVISDPMTPASPEHWVMLSMDCWSGCSTTFSFSQATKQIPQAKALPMMRGDRPWQKPATPCLFMMLSALLRADSWSLSSCISILRRQMGQRRAVVTVDDVMEAARSIMPIKLQTEMSEEEAAEQAKIQKILIELNKTGLSYLKHLQFTEAVEFFKKAEKIVTQQLSIGGSSQKMSQLAGVTFNNLACYYKKTRKPKVALKYLKRSLELEVYRINDWVSTGSTHLNICAIYSYLGKHQDALSHVNLALQLLQKKQVEQGSEEAKSYWNIRMLCLYNKAIEEEHLKQLQQSVESYQQAKHIAQKEGTRNIGIIMNCDEAIARIETSRASIKKRMIDILMRKKQEEEQGHYDFMRKHRPIKREARVGSEHQLNRFDLYKSREGRRREMTIKSQYKSNKVERGQTSSRFKSLNEYLNQKYKTEGTESDAKQVIV